MGSSAPRGRTSPGPRAQENPGACPDSCRVPGLQALDGREQILRPKPNCQKRSPARGAEQPGCLSATARVGSECRGHPSATMCRRARALLAVFAAWLGHTERSRHPAYEHPASEPLTVSVCSGVCSLYSYRVSKPTLFFWRKERRRPGVCSDFRVTAAAPPATARQPPLAVANGSQPAWRCSALAH